MCELVGANGTTRQMNVSFQASNVSCMLSEGEVDQGMGSL